MTAPTEIYPSTGNYHRPGLFNERKRNVGALAQRSDLGRPMYVHSTDFYDMSRIHEATVQRIAQYFSSGTKGANAWRLQAATAPTNNFAIRGGDSTAEGAARALVGGYSASLFETVDYAAPAVPVQTAQSQIHHQFTTVTSTTLIDYAAKWTAGALVGLSCWVNGTLYSITANTETELTLGSGFSGLTLPSNVNRHYYIALKTPTSTNDLLNQTVYLDVYIEDWGVAEDYELDHNLGNNPIEGMRRRKVIQQVWVEQVTGQQPTVDYKDSMGRQHYVLKIGTLNRALNTADISSLQIENDRNEYGGASLETVASRSYRLPCATTAESLKARLQAEETFVTVGMSDAMFIGADGLLEALECGNRTIWLRNGYYELLSGIVIPSYVKVVGESAEATLAITVSNIDPYGITLEEGASLENLSVVRLATATTSTSRAVRLIGPNALVKNCAFSDSGSTHHGPTVQIHEGSNVVESCRITKGSGLAVRLGDGTPRPRTSGAEEYGCELRDCYIRVTDALLSGSGLANEYAAIEIWGAVRGVVKGNTVLTDGQALRVRGSLSLSWPTLSSQEGADISGNLFVLDPTQALGDCPFVHLSASLGKFRDNVVDLQSSGGAHMLWGVYAGDRETYCGSWDIRGNLVRGAWYGIAVTSSLNFTHHSVKDNTILFAPGCSLLAGIYVDMLANSAVDIAGNYIAAMAGTVGIRAKGTTNITGNFVDGETSTITGTGIELLGDCHHVQGNFISEMPSYGIKLSTGAAKADLSGNFIIGPTEIGVSSVTLNALSVKGNSVVNCTVGLLASGSMEAEVSNNFLSWCDTGISGFRKVFSNRVLGAGTDGILLVRVGDTADFHHNYCESRIRGANLASAMISCNEVALLTRREGIRLQDCTKGVVSNNLVVGTGDGGSVIGLISVDLCGDMGILNNTCRVDSLTTAFNGSGIYVTPNTSGETVVQGNLVDFPWGGRAGIRVSSTHGGADFFIHGNTSLVGDVTENSDPVSLHSRSISASGAGVLEISGNTCKYGIGAQSDPISGDVTISDNTCQSKGIFLESGSGGKICNNHILSTPFSSEAYADAVNGPDRSPIWYGSGVLDSSAGMKSGMADNSRALISGNLIENIPACNGTGESPPGDALSSHARAAGIVVRSNGATVQGNIIREADSSEGLALLVGGFDDPAIGNRAGILGQLLVADNIFESSSKVLVVLASGSAVATQGTAKICRNSWKMSGSDDAGLFVLVDSSSNKANLALLGNELYYPDGGIGNTDCGKVITSVVGKLNILNNYNITNGGVLISTLDP